MITIRTAQIVIMAAFLFDLMKSFTVIQILNHTKNLYNYRSKKNPPKAKALCGFSIGGEGGITSLRSGLLALLVGHEPDFIMFRII